MAALGRVRALCRKVASHVAGNGLAVPPRRLRRGVVTAAAPAHSATDAQGAQPRAADTLMGQVVTAQANFVRVLVEPAAVRAFVDMREWPVRGSDTAADAQHVAALEAAGEERVEFLCVVRALLKKLEQRVLVGDFVSLTGVDWVQRSATVSSVSTRTSRIAEPPLANCNHILLMFSIVSPQLEEAQLIRFLVTAEASGLPITLALNKADLIEPSELDAWKQRLAGWGYGAFGLSLATQSGLEDLAARLQGRYTLVAGPSGVGKSSLINALRCAQPSVTSDASAAGFTIPDLPAPSAIPTPRDADGDLSAASFEIGGGAGAAVDAAPQAVAHVSRRNGRGRHTTRNVTLLQLPMGGLLADTPGFSYPSVEDLSPEMLPRYFPEIRDALRRAGAPCAFSNCTHTVEPGCAVGTDWDRYDAYCGLLDEVRAAAKTKLRRGRKEERIRYKSRAGGGVGIEARLDTKKHRRQSRRKMRQSDMDEAMRALDEHHGGDDVDAL